MAEVCDVDHGIALTTDECGGKCRDFDEDCFDIGEVMLGGFMGCWMHDPGQGYCPFLTGEEPK